MGTAVSGAGVGLILFDTDVLIDVGREVEEAVSVLEAAQERGQPAVSVVTAMELIVGCRDKRELSALDGFLRRFSVLPLEEAISTSAVELLRRYRLSHGLLIADALIAATARVLDLPFVSKNQRDYRFVEDVQLLPYPRAFPRIEP